jgi:hypothetical protein
MASGRVRAKYNLARDIRKSDNVLKTEALRAQEQNEAAADSSFWGRLGGMGLGAIAGLALAPFTAGTSLIPTISGLTAATIGAGVGSYAGSKAGEKAAGGIDTDVKSGGFGMDKVKDINQSLTDYKKGVDQDRYMTAASDAFSVYAAGGGLAGGGIGGGTAAFAGEETAKAAAKEAGKSLFRTQVEQLAYGGAKQYASKKGLGSAYESYMAGK